MRVMLDAYGQGAVRSERREVVIAVAQRNFVAEEMKLNMLAAYEQGMERQFEGCLSAFARWKRRLRRRYRWLKCIKKREVT